METQTRGDTTRPASNVLVQKKDGREYFKRNWEWDIGSSRKG